MVIGKSADGIKVRIGGTDRVVTVPPEQIQPPSPTGHEVLTEVVRAHRLVLLGCQGHGLNAVESLVQHREKARQPFAVIFMEGYPRRKSPFPSPA